MAKADAEKWDQRYRQGAYSARPASQLLQAATAMMSVTPGAMAADLACGRGRNALHLAEQGYAVHGYDISREGLAAAELAGQAAGLDERLHWVERDLLEQGLPADAQFDVIVMFRFVAPGLLDGIARYLRTGGWLIVEEHLQIAPPASVVWPQLRHQAAQFGADKADTLSVEDINGPRSDRFRVAPLALTDMARAAGLTLEYHYEGLVREPDGELAMLSQLVARQGA